MFTAQIPGSDKYSQLDAKFLHDSKSMIWKEKTAQIEIQVNDAKTKKFNKIHQFDLNLSELLNQHFNGKQFYSYSYDQDFLLEHKTLQLKVFADIEVGK